MTSAIDPTVPATNSPVASAAVRQNFATAKAEISALQAATPSTLPVPVNQGGTGQTVAGAAAANAIGALAEVNNLADLASKPTALTNLGALATANSLSELTGSASTARGNIAAAASGANSDITSLTGLTTPLAKAEGGNGTATPVLTPGAGISISGSWPNYTISASGGGAGEATPQGRLTLTSATPVMTGDATAQGTIYYDTYIGNQVPIAGTLYTIASDELSLILDSSNHLSGKLYDVFAIVHTAAAFLVTGPAWTNATTRSTALELSNGVWANAVAMTHAYNNSVDYGTVAKDAGTYLGTFYATANGQTGMAFKPAAASGGTANILGLYNGYNRSRAIGMCRDSTSSWSNSSAAWVEADASASNRISFVDGLAQSMVGTSYETVSDTAGASNYGNIGVNLDSTSATPGVFKQVGAVAGFFGANNTEGFYPQLGFHYIQAMESSGAGSTTFLGAGIQLLTVILDM